MDTTIITNLLPVIVAVVVVIIVYKFFTEMS